MQKTGRMTPVSVPPRSQKQRKSRFLPQDGPMAVYNRVLFQRLMRQIRYSADQWNFFGDQRNLNRPINRKAMEFRAGRENEKMWSRVRARYLRANADLHGGKSIPAGVRPHRHPVRRERSREEEEGRGAAVLLLSARGVALSCDQPYNATTEGAMNDIAPTRFKWVGTRPIRPDGVPKVTGRAMYGADFATAGHAVRQDPALAARACPHPLDRHLEGRGAARRQGGGHRQGFPGPEIRLHRPGARRG